jgi:hypothetical protein
MPLTKEEREFLDAYVYEATHEPFGGPAATDLRNRGIFYTDLSWLLTAFDREMRAQRILPFGHRNLTPPQSPWPDLENVNLRNHALRDEYERDVTESTHPPRPLPK